MSDNPEIQKTKWEADADFVYSLLNGLEKDWKWFVRLLGATDSKIETCIINNIDNVTEQAYQVMKHIFQKYPETSWIDIKNVLSFLKKNELIESIKEKYPWNRTLDEETSQDATYEYANATEFMLIIVSKHIVSHWQAVSEALHLPFYEAKRIIRDNKKDSREQAYQALRLIKQINKTLQWSNINSALKAINVKTTVANSIEKELKQYGLIEEINYVEKENCIQIVKVSTQGFSILSSASIEDLESIVNTELDPLSELPNNIMIHRGGGVNDFLTPKKWFNEGPHYYDKFYSNSDYFTFNDENDNPLFVGFHKFIKARKPGFIIHGYDILKHFHFLNLSLQNLPFTNHLNIDFNRQYIAYEHKNNALYFIYLSQGDTVEELQNDINACATSIQMFILLHKALLFNSAICMVPIVVVKDSLKQLIDKSSQICNNCRTFILTHKEFQSFDSSVQENLGSRIEISNRSMRRNSHIIRPYDKFRRYIGHILAFMAIEDSDLIPNLTNEVHEQVDQFKKRLNSMLLFSPRQLAVKNSNAKHLLIQGSYGSGKSIIGRIRLKQLANSPSAECIYYINYGSSNLFTKIMKDYVQELNQTNIFCYDRSEIGFKSLSEMLRRILNENGDKNSINVIVEELPIHELIEVETLKVTELLSDSKLRKGNVLFICESMISESFTQVENINQKCSFSDQVNLFTQKSSMTLKTLNNTARTTVSIDRLVNSAIEVLQKESNRFSIHGNGYNVIFEKIGHFFPNVDLNKMYELAINGQVDEAAAATCTEQEKLFIRLASSMKTNISDSVDKYTEKTIQNNPCFSSEGNNSQNLIEYDGHKGFLELWSSMLKSTFEDDQFKDTFRSFLLNREGFQDLQCDQNFFNSVFDMTNTISTSFGFDKLMRLHALNPTNENSHVVENKIKYQNSVAVLHNIIGSKPKVFIADINAGQGNNVQGLLLNFFKKLYKDSFVSSYEEVIVIHFEDNVPEVIPATVKKLFSDETLNEVEKRFSYENVLDVRGMEYKNVIIYMNLNEYHMRHYLVDAMTRCKSNLFFFVVKEADTSETNGSLMEVISKWQKDDLAECFINDNLNWLKEEKKKRVSAMVGQLSIIEDPLD